MTIRYRRAPTGYRVERVPTDVLQRQAATVAAEADLLRAVDLIRSAAAALRADARRRAAWRPPDWRGPAPRSDVTGADLKRAREGVGLSQRDLAGLLCYSRGLVSECERGRRSLPAELGDWVRATLRGVEAGGR